MNLAGFDLTFDRFLTGAFTGMIYGLLAVGLVLVYRASRFINFAHAAVGIFGASILGVLVAGTAEGNDLYAGPLPYWVAFPLACLAGGLMSGGIESGFVRRISGAPRVLGIVITLGLAQFLILLGLVINKNHAAPRQFPSPPGFPEFDLFGTKVNSSNSAMLFLTPLVLIALIYFLKRTRYGLAIRAAADNPDAASLAGVKASRMVSLSWIIAGALATFSATLVYPTLPLPDKNSLGPSLLVYALVGAVLARFQSLVIAFFASMAIGIVDTILRTNSAQPGLSQLVLAVVVIVGLMLQPRLSTRRDEDRGEWSKLQPPGLPEAFRKLLLVRLITPVAIVLLAGYLWYLGQSSTNQFATVLVNVVGFALVGLSVVIVLGIAGQLSLGQFAFAAIAGAVAVKVTFSSGNYWLAIVVGIAASIGAAILIGIPGLRLRGLALAVSTLAFSFATTDWLLRQDFLLGATAAGVRTFKPAFGDGFDLTTTKNYYLFSLVFLLIGFIITWNIKRSGFGRVMRALRDNEDASRALSIPATQRKLQTYGLSGLLAGMGGIVIAFQGSTLTTTTFERSASIDVVVQTVVGGLGTLFGPLIGAYAIRVPTGKAWLGDFTPAVVILLAVIFVVVFPQGIVGLAVRVRNAVASVIARISGVDIRAARIEEEGGAAADRLIGTVDLATLAAADHVPISGAAPDAPVILKVDGMSKSFGGVRAVQNVSLEVRKGEILGIIGPNGAGKTTLFEMVAGFTPQDSGTVVFDGTDVTSLTPEKRARLGVVRSFQAARLFPTMSVLETVMVAQERVDPTRLHASLLGLRKAEKRKEARARELIETMGLTPIINKRVGELSTGTRRMVEITCMLALEPQVLLLDEPAGGIAQAEGEALIELLTSVRRDLGTTLVIIEHDLPLLFRLADRLIAMELGGVIATGSAEEVKNHPDVVRSYLGADAVAVERSGPFIGDANAPSTAVPVPEHGGATATAVLEREEAPAIDADDPLGLGTLPPPAHGAGTVAPPPYEPPKD
jgi:ABC-type branched-subunit amino acid transport system ATPase component/branched-subunit amino acid ABC-type transport system permease component